MGEKTLRIAIWPKFGVIDSYEIVRLEVNPKEDWIVTGVIGPYLTEEEAKRDMPNINYNSFKKPVDL